MADQRKMRGILNPYGKTGLKIQFNGYLWFLKRSRHIYLQENAVAIKKYKKSVTAIVSGPVNQCWTARYGIRTYFSHVHPNMMQFFVLILNLYSIFVKHLTVERYFWFLSARHLNWLKFVLFARITKYLLWSTVFSFFS